MKLNNILNFERFNESLRKDRPYVDFRNINFPYTLEQAMDKLYDIIVANGPGMYNVLNKMVKVISECVSQSYFYKSLVTPQQILYAVETLGVIPSKTLVEHIDECHDDQRHRLGKFFYENDSKFLIIGKNLIEDCSKYESGDLNVNIYKEYININGDKEKIKALVAELSPKHPGYKFSMRSVTTSRDHDSLELFIKNSEATDMRDQVQGVVDQISAWYKKKKEENR